MGDKNQYYECDLFSAQQVLQSGEIDVVEMEFVEAKFMSWKELFSGYQTLHAITFSSGLSFIEDLLSMFDYAEIIFGTEHIMPNALQDIFAFQATFIEELRENKKTKTFVNRIQANTLKLYVTRGRVSHEKLYLLEAQDGRRRVIFGSANMSQAAFSGKQRENICYIDGDKAFDWYMDCFQQLKLASCDNITHEALAVPHSEGEIIPISQTVRDNKYLVLDLSPTSNKDVRFVLKTQELSKRMAPYMPKGDKGKIVLNCFDKRLNLARGYLNVKSCNHYSNAFISVPRLDYSDKYK